MNRSESKGRPARKRLWSSVSLFFVGLPLLIGAFATPSAAQAIEMPPSMSTSFDHYWRRYQEASAAGDVEAASRFLDEIRRLRVERNAFHLHDVALSFVYQGFGYLDSGALEEAQHSFEIARDLEPTLPTAYWGLARAAEREGGLGFLSSYAHRAQAQSAALRSRFDGPFAEWNLVFLLSATLMGVFFIFAAVMVYRYGVLLHHDFQERLDDMGSMVILAATVGFLLLPLILTAGFGWLAPYWLVVTFGYQSRKERAVSIGALVALLAAAPLVNLYVEWARTISNPVYRASVSSVTGTFDVGDVEALRQAAAQVPDDRDLQFLLATQYKNLGDYQMAANQLNRIIDRWPGDLEAVVNLGNIYFAQRDWDGALAQYDKAIAANSSMAMAHYNKSLAHAENFQFAEREDARRRADGLDAPAVNTHERATGDYRVAADARLDGDEIFGKFYGLEDGLHTQPIRSFVSPALFSGWGLRFVGGSALLTLLLVVLAVKFRDRKLTQRCWKCGSAFCGRCQIGTGRKGLCTQCYHLFFMKDGVSAAARNEKLQQVETASRTHGLVFRIFSIVAPGSGHVSEGMPLIGVFLLFFWVLGACMLLIGDRLYSLPDGVLGFGSAFTAVTVFLMLVVLVLANIIARPLARG